MPLFMGLLFIGGTEAIDPPELDETSWMKGIIDSESEVSNVVSAAIDLDGYLHVVYYDTNGQDLLYATNVDGLWKTEVVDDGSDNVGKHNSIAVDATGKVHISYFDNTNQDLKYASGNLGSWTVSSVDSIGVVGEYNSLVCVGNEVHIIYLDYSNNTLKHATSTGTSWALEIAAEDVGLGSSLATYNGKLYAAYVSEDFKMYCAVKNGTAWSLEEVDVSSSYAKELDIAVTDGTAFISYFDTNTRDLKVATRSSNGIWTPVVVDDTTLVGSWSAACGDSTGRMHVTYYDFLNQDLCYAVFDGATWSLAKLDESGGVCSAVVSDDNNKQHIFYIDLVIAQTPLSYITNSGAKWVATTIDNQGDVGEQSSIAVDADGFVHIAYYDDTNGSLNYANNVEGWNIVVVDNSSNQVGMYPSIALDSEGFVHISYYDYVNQDLRYATNAGGNWSSDSRDTGGDVGLHSSLTVDVNDAVHIIYLSSTSKNLKYTGNAGGDWVVNIVDNSGSVESKIATDIDSNGTVHAVYYRNGELIHANQNSTGWSKESVESTDQLGEGLSMFIDDNDVIYVTYYNTFSSLLKYVNNANGAWNTSEIIESGNAGGIGNAISVDSNGNERIVYVDSAQSVLKYAERRNGIWMYQKVDLEGCGEDMSMAIDSLGRAHISYFDPVSKDLRYTTSVTFPSAPLNLTADIDSGAITLHWGQPTNNGGSPITSFMIYRGSSADNLTLYAEVDGETLTYVDSGLENGVTWVYKIKSGNSEGYSVFSNEVTATPCNYPGAPVVDAEGEDGAVVLDWDEPDTGGAAIENYNIYRKNDSGVYLLIATVEGDVTYFKDTGLENGKEYSYYVTAVNPRGEGPESAPVSATPDEGLDMMLIIVIVIVVLAAVGVGAFFFLKKSGKI
ncbi:MAG: fibronectin type III domain-containing protein [Methanomassiliicoccales archaeon]